ncbi:MAG: sigma-70 family RNA polymerase sigma factor [Clostridiales bacterium]|nr:sigma-70 family RNA polymerase sigma factor [Candidatus Cacconaster stercorequi]
MICESGASYAQLEAMTDEALCALAQQEDRMAAEILAARFHRLVRCCARPYFLAGGDNEDLQQEGMFGLIKAMREYDTQHDASFRTFAETCIRNRLYTVLRASVNGKNLPLNQSVPLNPSFFESSFSFAQPDPEVLLIDREKTAGLLEDARKQLSPFERTVLEYYLDGLTYCEIAKAVGKPPKSVDNAVQRIRRKVARQLFPGEFSDN